MVIFKTIFCFHGNKEKYINMLIAGTFLYQLVPVEIILDLIILRRVNIRC